MLKTNLKQILFTVLLSVIAIFAYTNVSEATCIHTYAAATCTQPKTCTKCGATLGAALGHNYVTSGNIAKCTRCGATMTVTNGSKSFNMMTQAELEATYSKNNYLKSLSIEGRVIQLTP